MIRDPDPRFDRLSPRHRECLRLTYARKRTKEIASILGLSVGTVGTYCTEAIRILDARDRIDAAEQFAAWETANAPQNIQLGPVGVPEQPDFVPASETDAEMPAWRRLIPFRVKGAPHNDLGIFVRLAWIPLLALIFAIGFGVLADTVRLASDVVAGRAHR